MSRERELLKKAASAIVGTYGAVGTPGDFGYDSREGVALNNLYNVNNEITAFLEESKVQTGGAK